MTNEFDFGFGGEEFQGELNTVPYCQFLNGDRNTYGLAITSANAEIANFQQGGTWDSTSFEFADGTQEKCIYITKEPRLLVINRSQPLMTDGTKTIAYDKDEYSRGEYKAFSYAVVLPVDENNKPLSELPFRLKCSGFAGITFLKNYAYFNNAESFTKKFLNVYRSLTGDRAINKNDVFYAHAVYQPLLVREKATSTYNGQSSFAVQTKDFVEPTKDNFVSLIIKNGSPLSDKIKQYIDETKDWLKSASVEVEDESNNNNSYEETDGVSTGLYQAPNTNSGHLNSPTQQYKVKPVSPTPEQTEYATQIWQDCKTIGWTKDGLNNFLMTKHGVGINKLNTLSVHNLMEIYESIQEPVVLEMYCPQTAEADIPF